MSERTTIETRPEVHAPVCPDDDDYAVLVSWLAKAYGVAV
jgi:hypothetical protein